MIIEKLKDNISRTFYMRHTYAYVPVSNEKGQRLVYYENEQRVSLDKPFQTSRSLAE